MELRKYLETDANEIIKWIIELCSLLNLKSYPIKF